MQLKVASSFILRIFHFLPHLGYSPARIILARVITVYDMIANSKSLVLIQITERNECGGIQSYVYFKLSRILQDTLPPNKNNNSLIE